MAFCTLCRGEGLLAVMAASAGTALIHKVHGHPGGAPFHVEDPRMTFAAGEFLRMVLVCEGNRHSGAGEAQVCQLVAAVTDVLVQVCFLMGSNNMTLVTVDPEAYMFYM